MNNFDLEKAFDCINHEILLYKLEFYGITDNVYMLLKSYLQNRYQKVTIRSGPFVKSESDWGLVRHGVPQGSVLGPLLFLLYINDLPSSIQLLNVNPQTTLFTDDTSVNISNQNNNVLGNNLKLVFTSMMKWFRANLLSLNLDKTYCMEFHSKYITKSGIQIKYNNNKITNTAELKFLGLVLHNTVSWKSHIDMLAPKLNKACYIAR
jgi:hypothetical protein